MENPVGVNFFCRQPRTRVQYSTMVLWSHTINGGVEGVQKYCPSTTPHLVINRPFTRTLFHHPKKHHRTPRPEMEFVRENLRLVQVVSSIFFVLIVYCSSKRVHNNSLAG